MHQFYVYFAQKHLMNVAWPSCRCKQVRFHLLLSVIKNLASASSNKAQVVHYKILIYHCLTLHRPTANDAQMNNLMCSSYLKTPPPRQNNRRLRFQKLFTVHNFNDSEPCAVHENVTFHTG